jgi:hypothetical protein
MHFDAIRHTTKPTPSDSALPGLLHVIALTGNGLNCLVEDRHKHEATFQKSHEEILKTD